MGKYYFISDAHLGARYIGDPEAHERMLCDALEMMSSDAKAIFLMGDMLDFWFEWHDVVPRGYVRFFGTLARITDAGIPVYWFKGNHDMWVFDYLHRELGLIIVDDLLTITLEGKHFVLSHGDNLGPMPAGYKMLRALFRNRLAQRALSWLHPRITMPFAHGWSAHSRKSHGDTLSSHTPQPGERPEPAMVFALKYQAEHPDTDYYICGHRHVCLDRQVGNSHARLVILGDFFRQFTYAVFDGESVKLTHYDRQTAQFNLN